MKKMIFISQYLDGAGGVVRVVSNWSNYFIKKKFDVEVVSVRDKESYFELDKKIKYTIAKFRFKNTILNIPYNTLVMYKFLKQRKNSNIVFNKSLYIEPIWILRKLGFFKNINLVYFAHGGSSDFRDFYLSRKGTAHRVKMIFEAFDKVICLYDNEKDYPKQVKKEKLHFLPNPLPFEPSNIELNQKENIVLSLGRVTKAKGIDTLIKSWSILGTKTNNWKLQIIGDGEDKEEFRKLAKKLDLNNIEFLDSTTDVKAFYKKAKVFVIPSLVEGFGMTIIEAMACKCTVISSKTAGGLKLIKDNENGLLFKIGDEKELSEKLNNLIENDLKMSELASNGYKEIEQYKIENIAMKWNSIIKYVK